MCHFNGLSGVHECDRRQTDDSSRYGEMCSCMRNIAYARAISPKNTDVWTQVLSLFCPSDSTLMLLLFYAVID